MLVVYTLCDCLIVLKGIHVFMPLYLLFHRDTGAPPKGFGAVLPRHHADHNKVHLETTHRADYKVPHPYTATTVSR